MIFAANFSKFEEVEKLEGKTVRVTGKVTEYQKRPQIVLESKEQVKVQEPAGEKKWSVNNSRLTGFRLYCLFVQYVRVDPPPAPDR